MKIPRERLLNNFCTLKSFHRSSSIVCSCPGLFIGAIVFVYLTPASATETTASFAELSKRQQVLNQNVKAAALKLAKWCGEKDCKTEQKKSLWLALRFAGSDAEIVKDWRALKDVDEFSEVSKPDNFDAERSKVADTAKELYTLWQDAKKAAHLSLATEAAQDLLAADPSHEATRLELGYVKQQNQWVGPNEAKFLKNGMMNDSKFGWIKKEDVEKYRQGLRPLKGKFVPIFVMRMVPHAEREDYRRE